MRDFVEALEKMEPIKELKCQLLQCVSEEISSKGIGNVCTEEVGEVVDMVKDLAEAEKDCMEAIYYRKVTEAMLSYDTARYDSESMGYTPDKSRPEATGFHPHVVPYIYYDDKMTPKEYMGEATMNYSGNRESDPRYGHAYNEYKKMRRHYTETHRQEDKKEMFTHAEEHVRDTIATIRDIWADADPELKKRMKEDFTKLVGEMTV